MTDFLSALGNDLAVFSDLGTDPPRVMSHNDRVVAHMTRGGDELRLEFLDRGNGKVVEHPPNGAPRRSHASYRALLASETFSDLRLWANHQKTFLQNTLEPVDDRLSVEGAMSGTTRRSLWTRSRAVSGPWTPPTRQSASC